MSQEKNGSGESVRIVVACHFPLLREGISKILEEDAGVEVVAKASNLIDLIQSCEEFEFDILLLDVELERPRAAELILAG